MSAANKAHLDIMRTLKAFGIDTSDVRLGWNILATIEEAIQPEEISRRDYFAAKAMQGQLAFSPHDSFEKAHLPDEVAVLAYKFADAMIVERTK